MSDFISDLDPAIAGAKFKCPVDGVESEEMTLGDLADSDFGKSFVGRMVISSVVGKYEELRSTGIAEEDAIKETKTQLFGQASIEPTEQATEESFNQSKKKLSLQQK